jgi:predicted DNA binding CopG/RHH family protein
MKKLKPFPKKMPHFKSYEEEAHFWDTHDTSSIWDKWKPAKITFAKPMKHLISFRIDLHLLNGIQTVASRKHIPYQTLIHSWLAEKLRQEFRKSA